MNCSSGLGIAVHEPNGVQNTQVAPQLESLSGTGNGINEVPQHSLARVDYANEAEYGVNEQV